MNTMRYFDYQNVGEHYCLHEQQGALPNIVAGQVLVQVAAFGLNRADVLQGQGKYPAPPGHSTIPGLEVAGCVVACAENVDKGLIGKRVCCIVSGGGYAEYVSVDARHLIFLPDEAELDAAAGLAEVFLTSYQCLFDLSALQAGQRVLIHAGASGVGLAAIQLAKLSGATVAVTASSADKLAACSENGADILINYRQQDFVEVLQQQQFFPNIVIDVVGGDYTPRNLQVLALDGHIIQLAMLGGRYVAQLDMGLMLMKRAKLQGSTLRNRSDDYKAALVSGFVARFGGALSSGGLNPNIMRVMDISAVNDAHALLQTNQTVGKLVVRW